MLIELHEPFVKKYGLTEAALWGALCQNFYKYNMSYPDVYAQKDAMGKVSIKVPADGLEKVLGVKRVAQTRALRTLEEAGLITLTKEGMPQTRTVRFTELGVEIAYKTLDNMVCNVRHTQKDIAVEV